MTTKQNADSRADFARRQANPAGLARPFRPTRMHVLAAGLALWAAWSGPANAETKLVVSKAAPDPALIMAEFGKELGIFRKQGLDIEVPTIVQAKMVQAVIGGSVDMALASGATLAFLAKGAPMKAVAALSGPPRILVLVVRNDNSVPTVDQLPGHIIGVTNFGSLTDWAVSQLLNSKGWNRETVKVAAIGATSSLIAGMKAKNIDAAVIDIGAALNLEEKGEAKILVQFGDLIKNFQNQIIYASDKLIAENPAAVRGFLAGWFETIRYAKAHKAETVAYVEKTIRYSHGVADKAYDVLFASDFFSTDGAIDPATIAAMGKSFVDQKVLPQQVDLMQYVRVDFLPKR